MNKNREQKHSFRQNLYEFYKLKNQEFISWQHKMKMKILSIAGVNDMASDNNQDIFKHKVDDLYKNFKAFYKKKTNTDIEKEKTESNEETAFIYWAIKFFGERQSINTSLKNIEIYKKNKRFEDEKYIKNINIFNYSERGKPGTTLLAKQALIIAPFIIMTQEDKIQSNEKISYLLVLTIKATELKSLFSENKKVISENQLFDLISKTSGYLCASKQEIQERTSPFLGDNIVDYSSERDVIVYIAFDFEKSRKEDVKFQNRNQLKDFIQKNNIKEFSLNDVRKLKTTLGLKKAGFNYD